MKKKRKQASKKKNKKIAARKKRRRTGKKKKKTYLGPERRKFVRLSYRSPLMFKVCKRTTISKLMQGYTHDISQTGLKCTLAQEVPVKSTIWLGLDIGALSICEEIEKKCTIIQHGVLGKVVWVKKKKDDTYDVGVQFVTRQEKKYNNWIIKKPVA